MTIRCHVIFAAALLVAGCHTTGDRIAEHRAEFAALDQKMQRSIQRGEIEPGFTPDMVYMALGKPTQTTTDVSGNAVWLYRREPVTAPNETIQSGYRRRIVYDPIKRGETVIIEPIDPKAFPNRVPYTLRLTFRDGRLATTERKP